MTTVDELVATADAATAAFEEDQHLDSADGAVAAWLAVVSADPSAEYVNELGNALMNRYELAADAADLAAARQCYRDAGALVNLGEALRQSYAVDGDPDWLDEAVAVLERAVADSTGDDLATCRDNLGLALRERFGLRGATPDLIRAVELHERALRDASPDHPHRLLFLTNLAGGRWQMFHHSGDRSMLDAAIAGTEEAIAVTPSHSTDRGLRLSNLSAMLLDRGDVDGAVQAATDGVASGTDRSRQLTCLADAHLTRFRVTGNLSDVDTAVIVYRDALNLLAPESPRLAPTAHNLAGALLERYRHQGAIDDVSRAVELLRRAAEITEPGAPDLPLFLATLAEGLIVSYEVRGRGDDLNEAVEAATAAVELTDAGHPALGRRWRMLGAARHHRWDELGDPVDHDAATVAFRHAEAAGEQGTDLGVHHVYRYQVGGSVDDLDAAIAHHRAAGGGVNLGAALRFRYQHAGNPADLDEAMTELRRAETALPPGAPDRAKLLDILAQALIDRFERDGALADLDEAIRGMEESLRRLPDAAPGRRQVRNNLGNALRLRYTHVRDTHDLTRAHQIFATLVHEGPTATPDRYLWWDNLGNIFVDEFTRTGDEDLLIRAVDAFDHALTLAPDTGERVRVLANRAGVSWYRWEHNRSPTDLDVAVADFAMVASRTPPDAPTRAIVLNNLGVAAAERHEISGANADARCARAAFDEATGPDARDALWSLRAAKCWGGWAARRSDWPEAATAYERATTAMLLLYQRQLTHADQEQWLRETRGVAFEAGYAARAAGRPRDAVSTVESGRALRMADALTLTGRQLAELAGSGRGDLVDRYRWAAARLRRH